MVKCASKEAKELVGGLLEHLSIRRTLRCASIRKRCPLLRSLRTAWGKSLKWIVVKSS